MPGPEWMLQRGVLEELEIVKGSLKSPQKRRCRSNKSHREIRDQRKDARGRPFNEHLWSTYWVDAGASNSVPGPELPVDN